MFIVRPSDTVVRNLVLVGSSSIATVTLGKLTPDFLINGTYTICTYLLVKILKIIHVFLCIEKHL